MAYVSHVPVGLFSISIRPMGPDGPSPSNLWDPTAHLHPTYGTQRLVCHLTLAIHHKSLHSVLLYPACGTRWLTCHVYLWDLSPSPSDLWGPTACVSLVPCVPSGFKFSKKGLIPRSRTRVLDQGLEHLYHCARCLAVLTSLWSHYRILLAMLQVDLNWIYPL